MQVLGKLIRLYIDQGRFGEFVSEIIRLDYERKKEEAEEKNDNRLWQMYLNNSMTMQEPMSFEDWKVGVTQNARNQPKNHKMTNEQVKDTVEHSRNILKGFKV